MYKRVLMLLAFALMFQTAAWAEPKNDIEVKLTQYKVIKKADGKESFVDADKVKPGDIIEYRVSYRNTTQNTISQLIANLPVPAHTAYVSASAQPAKVEASLGGVEFAAVPLVRRVTQADGKVVESKVPVAEYKALRWSVGDLKAGKTIVVKARMKVDAEPVSPSNDGRGIMR